MFNIALFTIEIKKDNPTYERIVRSELHTLTEILKRSPTPSQVWAEMDKIDATKWMKYGRTKRYLDQSFPRPIVLDVPFVTQLQIGGHVAGGDANSWNDFTGCWYASACMVAYYFESGPRQGLPELLKIFNSGGKIGQMGHFATGSRGALHHLAKHHEVLAFREQLEPVPDCATAHVYTYDELNNLLRTRGPIFFYWMKQHGGQQYGHASVVIGVDSSRVMYHDPENAPGSHMSIERFNAARQRWKFALMQRRA